MNALELKAPPLVLVLLCAALMWALDAARLGDDFDFPGRLALAIVLAIAGVGVALSGVLAFRRARTTVNPMHPEQSSSLVATGVYRWTRNPMYLGFLLVLLAWAVYLGAVFPFVIPAAFVLYMNRFQIEPEERALRRTFGAQFDAYAARVRRWL